MKQGYRYCCETAIRDVGNCHRDRRFLGMVFWIHDVNCPLAIEGIVMTTNRRSRISIYDTNYHPDILDFIVLDDEGHGGFNTPT
jgi:hypothetical protein